MVTRTVALVLFMLLYGCNSYNLRYEAQPQPEGLHVYADYVPLQNAVGFTIDTNGLRLQEAGVEKPGGGELVRPLSIAYPAFGHDAAIGTGIGFGSEHVGLGTGIGVPVGPESAHGLTTATFDSAAIGPGPWTLHLKLEGSVEATIPGIGGPATAKH